MKTAKRMICVLLAVLMLAVLGAVPAAAAGITILMDGETVSYTDSTGYPYIADNGVVVVPVRQTMELFGAVVSRDAQTGEVLIQLGTKELRLKIGSPDMIVNGSVVSAAGKVWQQGDVIYAPAEELVNGLGGYVDRSDTQLHIHTQCADSTIMRLEWGTPIGWPQQGTLYEAANQAREAGNYAAAIPNYEKCLPGFMDNPNNVALCYGYLGTCYARTGQYDKAAAAYGRSSYYWLRGGQDQAAITYHENDRNIRSDISLYLKTTDRSLSKETTHGVSYEPKYGTVIGYTTEYFDSRDQFPAKSVKQAGILLKYFNWGYDSVGSKVYDVPENVVVELGVQPNSGMSVVKDADIVQFAKDLHSCGHKVMVRYANEMNLTSTAWYAPPEQYKAEFIRFAKIIRSYAPEVPLVWAPNFFPPDIIDSFYPGDAYVDYVGVSSYIASYAHSQTEKDYGYDVLGTGMKVQRWSQQLDFLYNHYGYKKPMIVAEGAASYLDQNTGKENVAAAAKQIRDFYTYLTIRYPNMKYAVYYNTKGVGNTFFDMTARPELINAYNAAIRNERYLSDCTAAAPFCYVPMDTFNLKQTVPASKQQLCAYVKYGDNTKIASVRYEINGKTIGTSSEMPYTVDCDFSKYFGNVKIKVTALDASGKALTSHITSVHVGSFADVPAQEYFAPAVGWAVGKKITDGTADYLFSPNATCTRAQIVTFLWRASGSPEPEKVSNPFRDVPSDSYFYKAVLWAVGKDITDGTGANTFSPDDGCTRGQVVTFLHRARNKPEAGGASNPFRDVAKGMFFYDAVLWAVNAGITDGTTETTFSPDETCTRGQIVTFLYRDMK